MDDVIKTCNFFLASSVKVFYMSLLHFALSYGLLPLCFSVSVFKGLRWITAFIKMDAVHRSFYLHSVPHSSFPTGTCFDLTVMEKKDAGGNYRLSKLRADTANTEKILLI